MRSIDLNADLGEGCGHDDELLAIVTSASIACGGHAGDAQTMRRTAEVALARGVKIGAHVSYVDRGGFGRRETGETSAEIHAAVSRQLAEFHEITTSIGAAVRFVKPHGALYHRIARDPAAADALAEALSESTLSSVVLLQPASPGAQTLIEHGVRVVAECFADRAYEPDGSLVDRARAGAVIDDVDEAAARAVELAGGTIAAYDGSPVALDAESICVHGDTPNSVQLARAVRAALEAAGVGVRAFS